MEVMLQLCVQTYETTVERGATVNTLKSSYNESTYENGWLTIRSPNEDTSFSIPDASRTAIAPGLQDIFSGVAGRGQGTIVQSSDVVRAFQVYDPVTPVEKVAISMTNSFCVAPSPVDAPPAVGTALGETIYISVGWAWFTLPICLDFMAALFLGGVIWHTKSGNFRCWKNESLPVLRGLSEAATLKLSGLQQTSEMELVAEEMDVTLEHDGRAWRLERKLS